MGELGQVFGRLLVHSGDRNGKPASTKLPESLRLNQLQQYFDVTVRKPEPLLAAYTQERVSKQVAYPRAKSVCGLWHLLSAKFTRQRQLDTKQPVLAADMAMTPASCGNLVE